MLVYNSLRSKKWSTLNETFLKKGNKVKSKLCDASLQFSSSASNMLYYIKNKHPQRFWYSQCGTAYSMSEDGSQPKVTLLLAGGRGCSSVHRSEAVTKPVCRMIETDMLSNSRPYYTAKPVRSRQFHCIACVKPRGEIPRRHGAGFLDSMEKLGLRMESRSL